MLPYVVDSSYSIKEDNNLEEKQIVNEDLEIYEDDYIYLPVGSIKKIKSNYENATYQVENENIISINNGVIETLNKGITKIIISANNEEKEITIDVSDLYTLPKINNDKEVVPCNSFTKEENDYIDKLLEMKIEEAGYETRAGVVAAARFLVLEFKYKIPYFYENGRLVTNGTRKYVDAEGRYYHKGLYLNESRFQSLEKSYYGPATWGCPLYSWIMKTKMKNGIDCSAYVLWALLNGGFDVGDVGAGISEKKKNDLDDLGQKARITSDLLNAQKIKVGDLFSRDEHIGILIGEDLDKYYVAESLDYDLHVKIYTKEELLQSDWRYIILMDSVYKEDGNLTDIW